DLTAVQILESVRHFQSLAVDCVDRAPVDGCGARTHLLVDAIAIADALDEREAFGELESDFDAGHAVLRDRVRRWRSPRGVFADLRPLRFDAAADEQGD